MSQWSQPGFQYPLQTGFPGAQPQQFQPSQQLNATAQFQQHQGSFGPQPGPPALGAGFSGLAPQPTGFPSARLQVLQQPQQTGFPGVPGIGTSLLQAQPTGFPGAQSSFQQPPPPPPVPPLPASYQQNPPPPPPPPVPRQQIGFLNANQGRLGAPSVSSFGAPGLVAQPTGVGFLSQPTGFAGRAPAPLVPQVTGFVDPRLQLISSSFMPANVSAPYTSGGVPQLAPPPQQQFGGLSLQQSFQQHNQAHGRGTTPKIPWTLSKAEKKQYDQIFRAWDAQGTGFISGQTALEVFGQSGLDRNDLARIWTLADADNRGKLNLAEFHVAMGLIYRRLNGNDIPDELPAELVPPSSRDLDTSVNFLKDILKNDTRARSPSGLDTPVSRLKERSFTSSSSFTQQGGRQDATVYKHEDIEPPGGFYQPRNRHVDRSAVRSRVDDASPATADLSSIKRQLLNTQKMLDDTLLNERSSDALDRELEDLRYRITRLQEDLEYVSKGPRTTAKEEERRRLERDLVRLMHEEVPELEKKVEEREEQRERQKREWARDRDRRNERSGRFGNDDSGRYSPASRYREEEERPYSRGASRYGRDDRDYDRDRPYRDGDRDRIRDGERDRRPSTATRTPPPHPPPASSVSQSVPAPPAPPRSPAPKNMTPEERQAFIRAEAQRRLEARKQALGVVASPSTSVASPTLDTTIEDRLAQEKKEAEEKARKAERQAEERERQRKEKLEAEKALNGGKTSSPTPTSSAPLPVPAPAPVPTPTAKTAPPPQKSRAPAPPPPRKAAVSRTSAAPIPTKAPSLPTPRALVDPTPVIRAPVPPALAPAPVPPAPVVPEEDPEDAALKAREEALRKKREERAALIRKLEQEEEEARKAEAAYQERRNQFLAVKASSTSAVPSSPVPTPAPTPAQPALPSEEPAEDVAPAPPVPPPAPPTSAPTADKTANNPFSRLIKDGGGTTPAALPASTANGSSNPFFRSQTAPPEAPPPSKSPGIPPPVKTTYHTAPKDSDDDWDDVMEKEEDSSDEELGTRDTRMGLAQQLFGNLLPSRPQSAAPAASSGSPISPVAPGPPPPPPLAPPAPAAPSAPVVAQPAPAGDRGALLSAIESGARLRRTVTNDRSGAATSGKVIGDTALPAHINAVARPPSPSVTAAAPVGYMAPPPVESPGAPPIAQSGSFTHGKKESVDWYNSLAADVDKQEVNRLPVTAEEDEEVLADAGGIPSIEVSEHAPDRSGLMADVDLSTEIRVRSLYPYAGQREEDLDFDTNMIIVAHPSKSGGDWWYGTTVKDGKTGFFPQTYVQKVERIHAKALYTYESSNTDELPFGEGDTVIIVDQSETDWWKAEHDGFVFVVPAAYLEPIEDVGPRIYGQAQLDLERGLGPRSSGDINPPGDDDHYEKISDFYCTPFTSPKDTRQLVTSELRETLSMDGEDDDDAYYSLDEDRDSTSEFELEIHPERARATVAREIERRRVLEAAGLVVSPLVAEGEDDGGRPPRPHDGPSKPADEVHVYDHAHYPPASAPGAPSAGTRSKSGSSVMGAPASPSLERKRRRPAPPAPLRGLPHLSTKDLPRIPTLDVPATDPSKPHVPFGSFDDDVVGEGEATLGANHGRTRLDGSIVHPDDAFERYETFKKTKSSYRHGHSPLFPHGHATPASASRVSMSSLDTGSWAPAASSPPKSPAASVTPSLRDRDRDRERSDGGESRASQFLSFLGRHARATTPDSSERDRKLVVSGPITHALTPSPVSAPLWSEENGSMRADSPVFGSSWASLVDRSALEEIPKEERKRQEAIFELISTEADYVRDVQLIVELFYSRLMEVLDENATAMIFSNVEDILLTNTTFFSSLEERQRDCRLYVDHIGDLLEKHMPNMGVYLNYCVNQANAGKALQQMRETNPALATQLQSLREDPSARNLDLSSYLLVPMQRLTRYPLLIRQIMHFTELCPSSFGAEGTWGATEGESILAALRTAEGILGEVNEAIRDREGWERLGEISRALWIGEGRLDLTAPTRHLGPRKLVKEDVLSKARSGRKLRAVLCSDILVLVDEADKGLYRVPIPVNEIQIKPSRSGREDPLLRLHLAYPRGGDTIILRASNVREAKAWKDAISDTGRKAREGIRDVVHEPSET